MNIRIYSPFFPFTMTEGAFQVIGDQVLTLVQLGHKVEVIIVREDRASVFEKMGKIDWDPDRNDFKLIFFENDVPTETRKKPRAGRISKGALFRRIARLENSSEEPDSEAPPKVQPDNRWKRVFFSLFSSLASPELLYYPPENDHRETLKGVDLAIYHYSFAYSWLTNQDIPQEAKKVVFFHNLESDLFSQRARATGNILQKFIFWLNVLKLRRHEKELSQICDEVWLISPPDQRHYLQRNSTAITRLVPPSFSSALHETRSEQFRRAFPKNSTVMTLGYIGGMDFGPNRESAHWILSRLAPELLKRHFKGKIVIAGKNPPPEILQLARCFPFVEVTGFLENTEEFWSQLSWMLVPHLSGSGVRMKLLEALASGVPVLAHPSAIERIHPALHNHPGVMACRSQEDWVQKIVSEQPFAARNRLLDRYSSPAREIPGLHGSSIYKFLRE